MIGEFICQREARLGVLLVHGARPGLAARRWLYGGWGKGARQGGRETMKFDMDSEAAALLVMVAVALVGLAILGAAIFIPVALRP